MTLARKTFMGNAEWWLFSCDECDTWNAWEHDGEHHDETMLKSCHSCDGQTRVDFLPA